MRLSIKARLLALNKQSVDVVREILDRGIKTCPSEFSSAINGTLKTPKADELVELADKIITGWEREAAERRRA